VSPELQQDLEKLQQRAYGVAVWARPVLTRYHESTAKCSKEDRTRLEKIHAWLLTPLSLWPFSMTDLLGACLTSTEQTSQLSEAERLLIDLLPAPPDESVCAVTAAHELQIQSGSYSDFVNAAAKFDQVEADLKANESLQRDWQAIKQAFDVPAKADYKGVIRRTMMTERNLGPDWSVSFDDEDARFSAAFDAFCLRWNLYGMQHDEPLLLKLAVHLTPYGTMMHIPAYWSFDPQRDIKWTAVATIHRPRAKHRQGETLAANKADRREKADKLRVLDAEAARLNLRGTKKHAFLCKGLGWVPETDSKRLLRLRKDFPE
jgi:hypothetical protein